VIYDILIPLIGAIGVVGTLVCSRKLAKSRVYPIGFVSRWTALGRVNPTELLPRTPGWSKMEGRTFSEAALAREARRGNRDALLELVRRHDEAIRRLTQHAAHTEQDARDPFTDACRVATGLRLEQLWERPTAEEERVSLRDRFVFEVRYHQVKFAETSRAAGDEPSKAAWLRQVASQEERIESLEKRIRQLEKESVQRQLPTTDIHAVADSEFAN
jgi:hypothetical protein